MCKEEINLSSIFFNLKMWLWNHEYRVHFQNLENTLLCACPDFSEYLDV